MRYIPPVITAKDRSQFYHSGEKYLIPVYSMAVSCGLFGIQDDHVENYISLDKEFIKNKLSTFIFRMQGESMSPYICEGDYLIVDRAVSAYSNRVVIVDIFDERVCKLYIQQEGCITLRSLNTKHKDLVVTEEMNMQIFGVATLCFRDLVLK